MISATALDTDPFSEPDRPGDDELSFFAGELRRAAREIAEGRDAVRVDGPPHLRRAFEEVWHAIMIRERARDDVAAGNQNVLLALEELARDQAAELAHQNKELRRQNEELAAASRVKSEFLATMSHELRTPLNAVIGYSELLLEGISGPVNDEQGQFLKDIHRSGRHLLAVINDLLDLAKVDAGRMEFTREVVDLALPALEAADITRALAIQKKLKFELKLDSKVQCLGDGQRIRQVALNLLSNAVKFSPEGSRITVVVREEGGMAELSVRDQGIGIDPKNHQLIFEAFRQIDGSHTRRHQGTGLGLTLVRKFCAAMGGTVEVESALQQGALFTVRLPLAPKEVLK